MLENAAGTVIGGVILAVVLALLIALGRFIRTRDLQNKLFAAYLACLVVGIVCAAALWLGDPGEPQATWLRRGGNLAGVAFFVLFPVWFLSELVGWVFGRDPTDRSW